MHIVWLRFLRSAYRREPITSFVLTAGMVAAAIGGIHEHWSLLVFGLGSAGGAIALRLWQHHRQAAAIIERMPTLVLPAHASRPSLPVLRPKRNSASGKP